MTGVQTCALPIYLESNSGGYDNKGLVICNNNCDNCTSRCINTNSFVVEGVLVGTEAETMDDDDIGRNALVMESAFH